MKTKGDIKRRSITEFLAIVTVVIFVVLLSSFLRIRIDLT